jgi:hypothetical protein
MKDRTATAIIRRARAHLKAQSAIALLVRVNPRTLAARYVLAWTDKGDQDAWRLLGTLLGKER